MLSTASPMTTTGSREENAVAMATRTPAPPFSLQAYNFPPGKTTTGTVSNNNNNDNDDNSNTNTNDNNYNNNNDNTNTNNDDYNNNNNDNNRNNTGELGYDRLNGTRKIGPSYAKSVVYI